MSDSQGRESMSDQVPGYVLGALSPAEARAFERTLAGSPELQREVAEYRELTALMASAEPMAPPADLRQRLLERVNEEKSHRVVPRRTSGGFRFSEIALGLGLAASVVLAVTLWQRERTLAGLLRQRDSVIAERDTRIATREAELNAILSPGVQLVTLTTTGVAPPVVQVFWDRAQHVALVHSFRLKPAPAGRRYQLWLMPSQGKPIASRIFNTEADGHGLATNIPVPSDRDIVGFAITEEPETGSAQPTSSPILYGGAPPAR